nr:TonB-dependent receptor [Hyphomonas sp. Mor2]
MNKNIKTRACLAVSALALTAFPGFAQETSDVDTEDNAARDLVQETVYVTATRREEGVQDVPASIQVIGGDTIDQLSLDSFEDILPSLSGVGFTRSGSGSTEIGIRGISNITGTEYGSVDSVSPIGVYIDDTPVQGGASLPDLVLYDLERVEVLKGPQGTLFGEGAMGGVLRFIPNGANLSEYEAKAEATVSNTENGDTNYQVRGVVNLPLIKDRLGARISAAYKEDAGYIDNVATGESNINDNEALSIRAIIDGELSENFNFRLTYMHDDSELDGLDNYNPNVGDLQAEFLENRFNNTTTDLYSATFEADLGFATASSISSYVENERQFDERVDLGIEFVVGLLSGGAITVPVPSRSLLTEHEQEAFTQEFRLVSNGDNRLNWVLGAFYRDRELQTFASTIVPNAQEINDATTALFGPFGAPLLFPTGDSVGSRVPDPFLAVVDRVGPETFEQYALYGEFDYELFEDFTVTFGARYFDETTTFDDLVIGYGYLAISSSDPAPVESSDNDILFKLGVDYSLNDDVLLYFTAAEGFRSGGGNLSAGSDLSGSIPSVYDSDSLWNYEAGVKSAWDGGRLIANAAVYYLDWEDIQTTVTTGFVPTAVGPQRLSYIDGFSDARVIGAEAELSYRPDDNWSFGYTMNVQDAEFTSTEPGGSILPDTEVPRAPELNLAGFMQYDTPLTETLSGYVRLDVQHTSSSLNQPLTDMTELFPAPGSLRTLDSISTGRLRAGIYKENLSLDLFVDNITDDRPVVGVSPFFNSFLSGDYTVTTIRPRTYGVTLRVNY